MSTWCKLSFVCVASASLGPLLSCRAARDSADLELRAIPRVEVGMPESRVLEIVAPIALESGTEYWGGTGVHRVYFRLKGDRQVWVEMSGGPDSCALGVGPIETLRQLKRHGGDSITVE